MRSFRRSYLWVTIGLVALAIQFAAAFGHHHGAPDFDDGETGSPGVATDSRTPLHVFGHRHEHAHSHEAPSSQTHAHRHTDGHSHALHPHDHQDHDGGHGNQPDGHHHDEEQCATCWSIVILAGLLLPAFAALYLISAATTYGFPAARAAIAGCRRQRAHRARAPPLNSFI